MNTTEKKIKARAWHMCDVLLQVKFIRTFKFLQIVAEVIWACWQPVHYLHSFSLAITTLLPETVNISQIIVSGKLHRFFIFIIYCLS